MVNFLILTLLILVIVFLFFKWNNYRTKLAYLFIVLGIGFLLVTGLIFFSDGKINTDTIEGVSSATKTYFSWIVNAGSNIIEVTTYALSQEWKAEEVLNETGINN
ncbi:MAG: hypothetical protein WDZ62_00145 [Candidatus Pacearchaeota archaeon]